MQFDSLLEKQSQENIDEILNEAPEKYLTFIVKYNIDTLNKREFKGKKNDNSIILKTIVNGKEVEEKQEVSDSNVNWWLQNYSYFKKDTLNFTFYVIAFGDCIINLKIVNNKVFCYYEQSTHERKIFKKKLDEKYSSSIFLKSNSSELAINEFPQKVNDTYYGKGKIITQEFYQKDEMFNNGYIKLRYRLTFLFKAKIVE